jgi:hypothetical protein
MRLDIIAAAVAILMIARVQPITQQTTDTQNLLTAPHTGCLPELGRSRHLLVSCACTAAISMKVTARPSAKSTAQLGIESTAPTAPHLSCAAVGVPQRVMHRHQQRPHHAATAQRQPPNRHQTARLRSI